jgi:hypothetical protein
MRNEAEAETQRQIEVAAEVQLLGRSSAEGPLNPLGSRKSTAEMAKSWSDAPGDVGLDPPALMNRE